MAGDGGADASDVEGDVVTDAGASAGAVEWPSLEAVMVSGEGNDQGDGGGGVVDGDGGDGLAGALHPPHPPLPPPL